MEEYRYTEVPQAIALLPPETVFDMSDRSGGKVFINPSSQSLPVMFNSSQISFLEIILKTAGWQFDPEIGPLTPDPERFSNAMSVMGVNFELTADIGPSHQIPLATYSRIIAEPKHPIGTADLWWYSHDIGFDHLTALLVGKATLMNSIGAIMAYQPETYSEGPGHIEWSRFYDLATALLRNRVLLGQTSPDEVFKSISHASDSLTLTYQSDLGLRGYEKAKQKRDEFLRDQSEIVSTALKEGTEAILSS